MRVWDLSRDESYALFLEEAGAAKDDQVSMQFINSLAV